MVVTSIDIDPGRLRSARELTGASSNKETVDLALKTLIAVRRQPAVVKRIIAREFTDEQLDPGTTAPDTAQNPLR
jgi:Arc/MetJ family transcription regulator